MSEESLKTKTKKGLYWKFADMIAHQGMQFVVGIFMARMLSPEDYGITAIPAVFMAIAGIFASAGFGQAMVRKKELTEADLSTAFYYSTVVGLVIYFILFVSSPYVADFYKVPVLTDLIRVTGLGFIYGPLGTPQSILLQRRLDFATPTKIGIVAKIISGAIGVSMAFYGYGVWALTISAMAAGIFSLLCNCYVVRWYPKTGWSKESFGYLWGYGNKFMASQVIDTVYNNITPMFIGKYYSTGDLGNYNRAQGYAQLPSQTLTGVIQNVSFPVLSKLQDDDAKLVEGYRRMINTTAFVVFPSMMLLAALARPLVIALITPKWLPCVILLQILCFSKMWYPIHAMNLNLLLVKGRTDLFLKLEVIKKIYGIIILVCTLPLGLVIFCCGSIVNCLISLVINTWYNGKLVDFGFLSQMKDLLPIFLLSLFVSGIVLGVTYIIPNEWLQILVGGLVGTVLYVGVAYILKMHELKDVKYLLSRK
ncbi:MAG: lipopolysaccharide biosynthesis protein [Prevotella sp.]|nr:lipopolysaccharide biosynthesis protein [Prevotella sp.]